MTVIASPGLERRLKSEGTGEVLFDRFTRGRYATDASSYQMMPLGVVVPRTQAEAERALEKVAERNAEWDAEDARWDGLKP